MYNLSKAITWNEVDDGAVILVHATGDYLHFDSSTCYAIRRVVGGATLTQLVRELSNQYPDINPNQIQSDYEELINALINKRILEESR